MTWRSRLSTLRDQVVTADAVYGTILFSALIAAGSDPESDHAGDGIPGDELHVELALGSNDGLVDTLLVAVTTLIVFWIAHVYARTLAGHGRRDGEDVRLGEALRRAVAHSNGMLWSAIPATLVLLLGVAGLVPDAADWALLVNLIVLGVLGYQALSERGRAIPLRVLGGVVTALLGLAIILVKIAVH